jgi:hypothetical protein
MTKVLILAASLGLVTSQAVACDFMRSASNVDDTTVASVSDETQKMSMPVQQAQAPVIVETQEEVETE